MNRIGKIISVIVSCGLIVIVLLIAFSQQYRPNPVLPSTFSPGANVQPTAVSQKLLPETTSNPAVIISDEDSGVITIEKIERMTPYSLALTLTKRWGTEKLLIDKATAQAQLIQNEHLKSFFIFCIEALLYKFNLVLTPKYGALFNENMDESGLWR